MIKYDLSDLGYRYKGVSTTATKEAYLGDKQSGWTITDIPSDVETSKAKEFVLNFLRGICAIEIPTSLVCNLRCRYCYIDDPRMKNKVVSANIVSKILETSSKMFPGLSPDEQTRKSLPRNSGQVYLSPWGAEPFANITTLELMQDFSRQTYGPGNYAIATSTNGTLWSDRAAVLFTKLIEDQAFKSIQVSLDGPQELQDFQRPILGGKGSYAKIENFVKELSRLTHSLNHKTQPYTFCSTIHLKDKNFAKNWIDAAEFFSTPNTWHTSLPALPMRMSGEDMNNKELISRFVEAQRLMVELVAKRVKQGILVTDFYTSKLFGSSSSHSKNSFPYCSALNTQIGIDLDGSLYPCHGPVTTPMYKPFLWFGNLFDRVISYRQLYRNFSYQYGTTWTRGRCVDCPIYNYSTGNVCWSCPAHNLAVTGEPSMDSLHKCFAYEDSFKYWVQIAKMTIDNPVLDKIPEDWFNVTRALPRIKNPIKAINSKLHFNMEYDGMINKGVQKFNRECSDSVQFRDSWWKFDHYFNEVQNN